MKKKILLFAFCPFLLLFSVGWIVPKHLSMSIKDYPIYTGSDLGVHYSAKNTSFKVWAPSAEKVMLRLYDDGIGGKAFKEIAMTSADQGTWAATVDGDLKNKFYTLQTYIAGAWKNEVTDIYANAVGVNGVRGMIVDLKETNPKDWDKDKRPALKSDNDIILWEVHTRDFSVNSSSGIKNKGKFLAFTEKGTKSPEGEKTGLDHIIDLGVTHIHLLPAFDGNSIDESKLEENKYNWGYDPLNYNTPEGSYSTDPKDGRVRIREFKEMVQSLHQNGLRVIMDVVYNHTGLTATSNFEQLVPGYYYRMNPDGKFSNASGCGNETASEHPMMRKFMIESLRFWANEYHVDGFRFDLMAIHDQETMNQIRAELDKIDPSLFLYGEGWTAGSSPLPHDQQATKDQVSKMPRVAVFSDEIRDGIRGHWSNLKDAAFMNGKAGFEESVKFGIVAATQHPQVDYTKVNNSKKAYASSPAQTIVYVTCHDNPCLWDKINYTMPNASESEKVKVQKLANAIVLTSQGVPFLQAGEEIIRTKHGVDNSYNSPDSINWLDWSRKDKYKDVYTYYKSLIKLRKSHPAFRMPTQEMISKHLTFFEMPSTLMIGYQISDHANSDSWKDILVYFNSNESPSEINLPTGEWLVVANGTVVNEKGLSKKDIKKGKTLVDGRSMLMLVDKASVK